MLIPLKNLEKRFKTSRQNKIKTRKTLPYLPESTQLTSQDKNIKNLTKTWLKSRIINAKTRAIILISVQSQKTSSSFGNLFISD